VIGQAVSHYRILEKIGSGGMGEIYLAEDTKLERKVALKFLPTELTRDPEAKKRFEREARAAAALNHPNIVTVYEIGAHEGQVFIAMEYVEGQTLKELIAADRTPSAVSRMPIPQVLDIAKQITAGLAAAHAKGIVHRDIKPQNIVIDKDGHVKILDFGLAKLKGVSPLTKESFTYGTVHYMSPEQALGKEVDPRSDIWSLGVVMYEMVGGELPFRGEYDQAVIYSILNEELPPLAAGRAGGLENVIRRCLAKKRQERYPSAESLADALRDLNNAKAATQPELGNLRKPSRRTLLTAASLLLLSGLLGFLALTPKVRATLERALGLGGIPRARHMAMLPINAKGDAEFMALGDGFTAVIIDKLTRLEKFHDSLWTVPAGEVFENRAKPLRTLQRLWGCNLFIQGDLHAEKNYLLLRLKLNDAVSGRQLKRIELQGNMANLTLFQDGLLSRLLRLLDLPEGPEAIRYVNAGGTAMPGAYIQFLKGQGWIQDEKNETTIDRGIRSLGRALQQDNRYLQARLGLIEAMIAKSRQSGDPGWLRLAGDQGLMLGQDASQWAPAQLSWATLLDVSHKKAEARTAWHLALSLDEHCYRACIELANSYRDEGRTGEAEKYYKQAIRLRPGYPMAYANLAYFYNLNGRYDEALDLYGKVTEQAPGNIDGFNNLGSMYWKKGDLKKARAMFEKANAIQPDADVQSNLATLYFYEGEYRKALPLFNAVGSETDDYVVWGNLADTCRQLPDQRHKAGAAYEKAVALAQAFLATSPNDVNAISCLAMYYAHQGEKDKALAAIARARALAPANLEMIRRAVLVHEAVGERSQALAALSEYRERLGEMDEIEREPDLAALRADQEYQRLIHEG
jgi:tetratricopeptide (TPR) repeat protein/predicted Ser/Thr protein kinase